MAAFREGCRPVVAVVELIEADGAFGSVVGAVGAVGAPTLYLGVEGGSGRSVVEGRCGGFFRRFNHRRLISGELRFLF